MILFKLHRLDFQNRTGMNRRRLGLALGLAQNPGTGPDRTHATVLDPRWMCPVQGAVVEAFLVLRLLVLLDRGYHGTISSKTSVPSLLVTPVRLH
jgi:hypothetical protein